MTNQSDKENEENRIYQKNVYEMLWDCSYCGTDGLLGKTHRFCPHCGAPQHANARYFPTENEKIAVHEHVYVGIDKICRACETANSANAEFCGQCGSPLNDAANVQLQPEQPDTATGELPFAPSLKGKKSALKPTLIVIAIAIIVGLGITFFWTKNETLVVTGHSWEHEIKIQDFAPRSQSDWCDRKPSDAYSVTRLNQVRSHRQIPDGETCSSRNIDQGDGTFRQEQVCQTTYRSEPIYDDFCYYTVDRWEYARSLTTAGNNKNPQWTQDIQLNENEQEQERIATYNLHFNTASGEKSYQCAVDEKLWQSAPEKSKWQLKIRVVTGGIQCETLQSLE